MAQPIPEPSRRYWPATAAVPRFPRLDADRTVDVVVIGAGLTGITTTFALKEAGLTVALVERRRVGGVDTASTTAHLTAFADAQPSQLVSRFGVDDARLVWDAGAAAIDHIAARVESLGIDCGFARVPGFYHVPFDADEAARDGGMKFLDEEAAALRKIGIPVQRLDAAPLVAAPALRITEAQARVHPLCYLAALVALIPGHGSLVVEGDMAMVTDTPGVVACGPHVLRAGHVVFATHNPMQGSQSLAAASLLQTNLALYTSYALRARLANAPDIEGLFWDTSDPYRYVRVDRTADGADAICGGEDHKTGQAGAPLEHREALARWVAALFPGASIAEQWSGQVIEPADGLPMVGQVAEREYVATGFSGNGTTFGTIAALIIRDAITGRPNRFAERFAVGRTRFLRQPVEYVRENIDYPYHVVRDWLARNPPSDILASLAPGEGRLVDVEGTVMAASRDDDGRLSLCGSVCTHLGCRVGWNAAERTWDCPCHGSRFDGDGHVIAGPAEREL